MSVRLGSAYGEVRIGTHGAQQNVRNLSGSLRGLDQSAGGTLRNLTSMKGLLLGGLGAGAALLSFGALVRGMGSLLKAGSDVQEMMGKFNVVFEQGSGVAVRVAQEVDAFAKAVGRNKYELRSFAAAFGDTFKPLGFTVDEAGKLSTQLTQLTVDLSSFNNVSEQQAFQDLQSAIVGNHETMRKYGVIITETVLKQELARLGLDQLTGAALEQAKVQARLNVIMAGTQDAQGDAARTADGWANQMRRFLGILEQGRQEIGLKWLPAATPFLKAFADIAEQYVPRIVDGLTTVTEQAAKVTESVLGGRIIEFDLPDLPAPKIEPLRMSELIDGSKPVKIARYIDMGTPIDPNELIAKGIEVPVPPFGPPVNPNKLVDGSKQVIVGVRIEPASDTWRKSWEERFLREPLRVKILGIWDIQLPDWFKRGMLEAPEWLNQWMQVTVQGPRLKLPEPDWLAKLKIELPDLSALRDLKLEVPLPTWAPGGKVQVDVDALLDWAFPPPTELEAWTFPPPTELQGWRFPSPSELLQWRWPSIPTPAWLERLLNWRPPEIRLPGLNFGDGTGGANARGTDHFRGGWTWVGERGRELVALPAGSRILTHGQSNRMAAASAGGGDIHVAVTVERMDSELDLHAAAYRIASIIRQMR